MFLNFDADAEPLAPRLAGIDRYVDNFRHDRFDVTPPMPEEHWNANRKLIIENAMDWVHLFRTHSETLDPIAPTRNAYKIEGSPHWTVTASRLANAAPKHPDDPPSLGAFEREMKARHGRGGELLELDRPIKDFHHYLGSRLFDHEMAKAWQAKVVSELRVAADGA